MRPSWSGELKLVGFPIKVAAYPLLRSKSADSFKMLDPVHQMPVTQLYVDRDGKPVHRNEMLRGVEVYGGIKPLTAEAVKSIQEAERTRSVDAVRFPRRQSVPLQYATAHYVLVPPEKAPEAGESLNVLWNGLKKAGRVLVTEITMRAGARPRLVAIEAMDTALVMHELPYVSDFQEEPGWHPKTNRQAAQLFEKFVEVSGDTSDFKHEDFTDGYRERREAVIEAALAGKTIATEDIGAPPTDAAPDLMAELERQLAEAKPAKSPRPKRKVAA
jgi:Ku protein